MARGMRRAARAPMTMPAMAPAGRPLDVLLLLSLVEEGSEELEGGTIGTRCCGTEGSG